MGDEAPLEAASEMLGCNIHHLRNALLTRSLAAGGEGGATFMSKGGSRRTRGGVETLTVPLDKIQASRARDTLSQEVRVCMCMYARLGPQSRALNIHQGRDDTLNRGILNGGYFNGARGADVHM